MAHWTEADQAEQQRQDASDLLFYAERGYLVVETPAETESWYRRKRLEQLLQGDAA